MTTNGPAGEGASMRQRRILVAEDDSAMRGLLADALREEGYQVDAVDSGTAVIDRLHGATAGSGAVPDVLVSDMRMPGCTGLETVRRLRDVGVEMHVFLMSAFGTTELRDEAYELGVLEVFDKPFDLEELLAAIRRLDRHGRAARAPRRAREKRPHG